MLVLVLTRRGAAASPARYREASERDREISSHSGDPNVGGECCQQNIPSPVQIPSFAVFGRVKLLT